MHQLSCHGPGVASSSKLHQGLRKLRPCCRIMVELTFMVEVTLLWASRRKTQLFSNNLK